MRILRIEAKGSTVDLAIAKPTSFAVGDAALKAWVERGVRAVEAYLGRFPVPHVLIDFQPGQGGVCALGEGGAVIGVNRPRDATDELLRRDWVMTHELMHFVLEVLGHHQAVADGRLVVRKQLQRAR